MHFPAAAVLLALTTPPAAARQPCSKRLGKQCWGTSPSGSDVDHCSGAGPCAWCGRGVCCKMGEGDHEDCTGNIGGEREDAMTGDVVNFYACVCAEASEDAPIVATLPPTNVDKEEERQLYVPTSKRLHLLTCGQSQLQGSFALPSGSGGSEGSSGYFQDVHVITAGREWVSVRATAPTADASDAAPRPSVSATRRLTSVAVAIFGLPFNTTGGVDTGGGDGDGNVRMAVTVSRTSQRLGAGWSEAVDISVEPELLHVRLVSEAGVAPGSTYLKIADFDAKGGCNSGFLAEMWGQAAASKGTVKMLSSHRSE